MDSGTVHGAAERGDNNATPHVPVGLTGCERVFGENKMNNFNYAGALAHDATPCNTTSHYTTHQHDLGPEITGKGPPIYSKNIPQGNSQHLVASVVTNPYNGAVGRPSNSLESIMVTQSVPTLKGERHSEPLHRAAQKIQDCQRFWTAPRIRAQRYDPRYPNQASLKPGCTRLPGFELSTREGIALHYLLEHGRIAELIRSLSQLEQKGGTTTLTGRTYLPLITQARRLGEPSLACAILLHAEHTEAWITSRCYDEAIEAQIEAAEVDLAEALAGKAIKRGFRPAPHILKGLARLGSHTPDQWQAKWGVQVLRMQSKPDDNPEASPISTETAAVFVIRGSSPNQEILCDGQGIAALATKATEFTGVEMQTDECQAKLKSVLSTYKIGKEGQAWVESALRVSPEGHACTQIRDEVQKGQNPTFKTRVSFLRPKDVWDYPNRGLTPASTSLHVRAWLYEMPQDDQGLGAPTEGHWLPVDEALYTLSKTDQLGQWADLLLQCITAHRARCPTAAPKWNKSCHTRARLLIACEESMVIQTRFRRSGLVETLSVDMVSPEHLGGRHLVMDATPLLHLGSWDAMIAFPPCVYLSNASGLYLPRPGRRGRLQKAVSFFLELYTAPIPKVVVENPKHSNEARKLLGMSPSQCIHPHSYSAPVCKPTQLYVRGLPLLQATKEVGGRLKTLSTLPPTPLRGMIRARTFDGIADAMAAQWTGLLIPYYEQRQALVRGIINAAVTRESSLRGKIHLAGVTRDALLVAAAWARHSPNAHIPGQAARKAMQRQLRVTDCGRAEQGEHLDQPQLAQTFSCWKRQAELQRGQLFGTARRATPPNDVTQLMAMQLMRRSGTEGFAQESGEDESRPMDLTHSLPLPPVKRVVRRMGSWWAWVAAPHANGQPHLHPKWQKVPDHLQALLESTTKKMQPQLVAANFHRCRVHGQAENRAAPMRTRWLCLATHLRKWGRTAHLEQAAREHRRGMSRRSQVLTDVKRDLLPCPACHKPRSSGGCPRGLGSLSCKGEKTGKGPIWFVPAAEANITNRQRAEIAAAAVIKRRRGPKAGESSGNAGKMVARMYVNEAIAGRVEVDETDEPELIPLKLPFEFGDDAISTTPKADPKAPTACAWVKDVLISTRNQDATSKNALYLVGKAGAWAPSTIADTGATISLIGTELLARLPHDAIAEFTPPKPHEVANVAGPNGEPLNILGKVKLLITISKVAFSQEFFIVRGGDLLLLGSDFLAPREGDVCLTLLLSQYSKFTLFTHAP